PGPGFLAGDYFGASGQVTVAAGLGANVLIGGSNRTVALQPLSVDTSVGTQFRPRRGGTASARRSLIARAPRHSHERPPSRRPSLSSPTGALSPGSAARHETPAPLASLPPA